MGLKILHSADWHLDSPFSGFSDSQRRFLQAQQRLLPGKVADLCRREDCDLMVLAGDLFDGKATRETLEILKSAFRDCGVPVIITPGNHDYCLPGSPWLEESWPENVFIFTGPLESVTIAGLRCRIYGAGYRSMDCPALLEDFHAEGQEPYRIAVLHGDAVTPGSPYCPVTAPQVQSSGLSYIALGHVHKAGAFQAGQTLCSWPGTPMGRGWDECGEKGVLIVDLAETAAIRTVSLNMVRFEDHTLDIGQDPAAAVAAVLPAEGKHHFYRITLTGTGQVHIPALKRQFSDYPNLEFRDRTQPPVDLWADIGADTLEGTYFRYLKEGMDLNPQHASLFLQAAEISRKLLDGREVTLP